MYSIFYIVDYKLYSILYSIFHIVSLLDDFEWRAAAPGINACRVPRNEKGQMKRARRGLSLPLVVCSREEGHCLVVRTSWILTLP